MNTPETKDEDAYFAELRQKSEEKLRKPDSELGKIPDEQVQHLRHELLVHHSDS
jgi:hypothetical protein